MCEYVVVQTHACHSSSYHKNEKPMPIALTHVNVADPIMTSGLLNPHATDLTHLPPKSRISVEQYHTTAGSTHE